MWKYPPTSKKKVGKSLCGKFFFQFSSKEKNSVWRSENFWERIFTWKRKKKRNKKKSNEVKFLYWFLLTTIEEGEEKFVGSHSSLLSQKKAFVQRWNNRWKWFSSFRVHLHVKRAKIARKIYFLSVVLSFFEKEAGTKVSHDESWSQFYTQRLKLFCQFNFHKNFFSPFSHLTSFSNRYTFSFLLFSPSLNSLLCATVQTRALHLSQFSKWTTR